MSASSNISESVIVGAGDALRTLQREDPRLSALSARLWRFPTSTVLLCGITVAGKGEIEGNSDPTVSPETVNELRDAMMRRVFRVPRDLVPVECQPNMVVALKASSVEPEAETPREAAFLAEWHRQNG